MADPNLVNYVRQLLQMGYDANAIRSQLYSSGYSQQAVEEAVNAAYASQQPYTQPIAQPQAGGLLGSRKFLFGMAGIVLFVAAFLVFIIFFSGGKVQPEMFVYLDSDRGYPGDEIGFSAEFVNLEGSGMASLKHVLIGTAGGSPASAGEKQFLVPAASIPSSFEIPEGAEEGLYSFRVILSFEEHYLESSFSILVLALPESEPAETTGESGLENASELPGQESGAAQASDSDGDGIADSDDLSPFDYDNDGIQDSVDDDIDDDGILNRFDSFSYDRDNDGIRDVLDSDNDNDGVPDSDDLYPFDYDNDGVPDKRDDSSGRGYEIPSSQSSAELSFKCTSDIDCNDYDICTSDSCVSGFCESARIPVCCGDFICSSGEDSESCPQDCIASQQVFGSPSQEVIAGIMETAASNPEKAASQCSEFESSFDSDLCYTELAKVSDNYGFCENVYDSDSKDKCFMYFVMSKDKFELCVKIEKRLLQNSCYSIKNLKQASVS